MRKFAKISAVFAAVVMVLVFAGCKSDDDDVETVAVYKFVDGDSYAETVTFYDDNTFKVVAAVNGASMNVAEGTYTGNPAQDGTVGITVTRVLDEDGWVDVKNPQEKKVPITDGKAKPFDDEDEYIRQ